MQINNDILKKLSNMSDDEFKKFISGAALENGIALPNVSEADIAKIRALLVNIDANDPGIAAAVSEISKNMSGSKKGSRNNH